MLISRWNRTTTIVPKPGGKFKKWEESSARVIKCDEASVHRRDQFVGHETHISDYVNPDRQLSGLDGNPKSGCECLNRGVAGAGAGGGGGGGDVEGADASIGD